MDKIPLVLFSGGLDSTYLLWKTLQDTPCDVIYADGGQAALKVEAEVEARKKVIEYVNATCPYKVQQEHFPPHPHIFAGSADLRYSQPMAWLSAALCVVNGNRHSELLVGYVYDDGGFCRWLPEISNTWHSMQTFTKWHDPIPVRFPIIDTTKCSILERIDPELATKIWVCENPDRAGNDAPIKPCLKCQPCRKMKATLVEYRERNNHDFMTRVLYVRQRRQTQAAEVTRKITSSGGLHGYGCVIKNHVVNVPFMAIPRIGAHLEKKDEDTDVPAIKE